MIFYAIWNPVCLCSILFYKKTSLSPSFSSDLFTSDLGTMWERNATLNKFNFVETISPKNIDNNVYVSANTAFIKRMHNMYHFIREFDHK